LVSGCGAPPISSTELDTLSSRVEAILEQRGLGSDTLFVIDNIVRHEAPPPRAAPPVVRRLLADPLKAADAAMLFSEAIPRSLQRLASEHVDAQPQSGSPVTLMDLLGPYLDELAAAQAVLKQAERQGGFDENLVVADLARGPLAAHRLRLIGEAVDTAAVDRAMHLFLDATARFAEKLRSLKGQMAMPDTPQRFDSAVGVVSIGTIRDDNHGPDAAVIVDPGGNDTYQREPALAGAVSVIVDLDGNDRYLGSDIVVRGLSALIDLSGNDRYSASGPGLGAAVVGASVILDVAGDDVYEAGIIGQGAAAFGVGAIIDLAGNDSYTLRAGGQGFGLARGVGLLWDRSGNDRYRASGLDDAYGRGGGVSNAQGAAFGFRTSIGAGIGILRDDQGDDRYEAQMFAQGMGFYYGLGVLWDRGGSDTYHAVRYAQGNGVHEAVGILRDEAGNDEYVLSVGVGQGMGLDLSIGVLFDAAGNDRYRGPVLVQGTGTANGIGILVDGGGADQWTSGANPVATWGAAKWSRGLPTLGILVYEPAHARFFRDEKPVAEPPHSREWGGPDGNSPVEHESGADVSCPDLAETLGPRVSFSEALGAMAPGLGGGTVDAAAYAEAQRHVREHLARSVASLPRDNFTVTWALGAAIDCALAQANESERGSILSEMRKVLNTEPATPFAAAFVGALFRSRGAASLMEPVIRHLRVHPSCGVRSAGLSLTFLTAEDDGARTALVPLAQEALRSTCWRLQATAKARLLKSGLAPDKNAGLPSFLRDQ
jgi:hypothetical protein